MADLLCSALHVEHVTGLTTSTLVAPLPDVMIINVPICLVLGAISLPLGMHQHLWHSTPDLDFESIDQLANLATHPVCPACLSHLRLPKHAYLVRSRSGWDTAGYAGCDPDGGSGAAGR